MSQNYDADDVDDDDDDDEYLIYTWEVDREWAILRASLRSIFKNKLHLREVTKQGKILRF